jgi:lipoate synthase
MLGLGETENEVMETLIDLKRTGCRYLTLGQYLSPSPDHVPVAHYLPPEEFDRWAETARHWDFQALPPVRWYEVLIAPMRCLQNRKGSPQSSQRTLRRP